MFGLGTIINTVLVLVGGLIGLLFKKFPKGMRKLLWQHVVFQLFL